MIIYQNDASSFLSNVDDNTISDRILDGYIQKIGRGVSDSEIRAWDNSLQRMSGVIRSSKIPMDCGVMVEYCINPTNFRIDFVISGHDDQGNKNFIIIELKQWSPKNIAFIDGVFVVKYAAGSGDSPHPSYQAHSYKEYLTDMNETVYEGRVHVESCSYLHNYKPIENDPLFSQEFEELLIDTPAFVHGDEPKLNEFLRKYVGRGNGKEILYEVENGKIRPSKKLVEYVDRLLKGNRVYTLLDKQAIAYANMLSSVRNSTKRMTIIVNGGPGTGKSVVAVNALVALAKDYNVRYATPNAAFRTAIIKSLDPKLKIGDNKARYLFSGTGQFTSRTQDFDVIIVDEAHRLKSKGTYQYSGDGQVEDVIMSSRVSIFFVDDQQRIRPNDEGTEQFITDTAIRCGNEVKKIKLDVQFRCSGVDGYINWLDHTLQIQDTANYDGWEGSDFRFEIVDDPKELYSKISELNSQGEKARMLAGFAWDWSPIEDGLVEDVSIPECGFSMPWNSRKNSTEWAIRDDMADQIGCIHTSQGLEFDYVGVIIGNDLKYDPASGDIYASYDDYKDGGGKKGLKDDPEKLTQFVKQIYKVLMTRGMKGCFVYVRNPELRDYLKSRYHPKE